ncbi:glycosyltransferase [Snuella sedimenti]|uniref:Glycosyltransferase n=1 Tax=Snuella sedimenti TaxID=2798802 RepID=A0A8J7LYC8_9FLAO|nr:glycosyltransferase [Snuella sedimenti]MBJ6368156.1 glycosyltransferase [Snuella sedimenti]
MNYLLSIIIPTKDRYTTLLPVLDSLLNIDSKELEIVVQDNSVNNNDILKYIELKKPLNLSYYYSNEKLSIVQNSDRAVLNSKGDYICFIGDDDGVMPYIIDVAGWMKINDIEAVKGYKPSYSWPGQQVSYLEKNASGVLRYENFNYGVKKIDVKKALKYNLSKGGTDLSPLPCLYHGIVSRNVLNKIYNNTKSYFPGPSPDMANAIALSLYVEDYRLFGFPIVISGKSMSSTGGKGVLHKHIAKIEDVPHLPSTTNSNWSNKVPKYWTGPTIWAESVIKSLEACGGGAKVSEINFSYLYAELYVFQFSYRKQIFNDFNNSIYSFKFFFNLISVFFKRVITFFKNRLRLKITTVYKIDNIGEAIKILDKKTNKKGLPFIKKTV